MIRKKPTCEELGKRVKELEESENKLKEAEEVLLIEKNKLQSVINSISSGITVRDLDYNITYQSQSVIKVFGCHLGEKCYKVFEGKDEICEDCPVESSYLDGQPHTSVREVTLPTGETAFYENTANPIRNSKEDIISCLEVVTDITQRKRAENALRESENRYRTLFERSTDAIFLIEKNTGRYLDANQRAEQLTGRSLSELKKLTTQDITPQKAKKRMEMISSEDDSIDFGEVIYIRPDGTERNTLLSSVSLVEGAAFGIAHDITESKVAEEALRENHEKLLKAQMVAKMGFLTWNLKTKDMHWSEEIFKIYGLDRRKVKPSLDLAIQYVHPDDLEFVKKNLDKAIKGIQRYDIDHRLVRPNGEVIWVDAKAELICDANGNLESMLGTLVDITERKKAEEELRESELRYRSLFENMLNGYAYCKMLFEGNKPKDFMYIAVNSAFETLTGLHGVVGNKVTEVIPGIKKADPELFEIYGRVSSTGTPETFEMHVDSLGEWFSVSVFSPERGFFVAVFDVITERKRAEEALQESHDMLLKAQQVAKIGFLTLNLKTNDMHWSEEAFHIYGLDRRKVKPSLELTMQLVHPDDLEFVKKSLDEAIKGIKNINIDHRLLQPNGKVTWINAKAELIINANGNLESLLGTIFDITERKQAEEALRESEEMFRVLFENTTSCIFILKDRVFQYVNQATLETFGYTNEEMIDHNTSLLYHSKDSFEEAGKRMLKSLQEKGRWNGDLELKKKDSESIWMDSYVSILPDGGAVGILHDITEKKQLEDERSKASKLESIGLLAGGIAHDFNNILSIILGVCRQNMLDN